MNLSVAESHLRKLSMSVQFNSPYRMLPLFPKSTALPTAQA